MKAIILAAGSGKRLGSQEPKCLLKLPTGKTIIENQIEALRQNGLNEIIAVVGFKKELIMERNPGVCYVYNPYYHVTNTSKSLMLALSCLEQTDVVWLNGDIYLEPELISRVVSVPGNNIAVNTHHCGEEEVKYKTDNRGAISEISKEVWPCDGECIGVNTISERCFAGFLAELRKCEPHDYFEKAVETAIAGGMEFRPVDISDLNCVEIDFAQDFEKANGYFEMPAPE
jgi:choline kinase